jgi:putative DNA primase/helicase
LLVRAKAGRLPARDGCIIVRAADIQPCTMPWLWYGHLPADALEIIAGVPDAGKSQVQCQYVACVTTKRPWPDGAPGMCEPRNVIMLTAEDTLKGMLVPRLVAAGADLTRVEFITGVRKDDRDQMFLLAEDLEMLERTIAEIGDVGLVVIDPITAYMGGKVDSHRATDVRSQLGPLKDLAERAGVGFSVLTHPPKNAGQRAIDQYLGSQAFIAAPRIGHLCLEEFEQDEYGQRRPTGRRLFTNSKNNPMPKRPTIAYRIVDAIGGTDPITGAEIEVSKIAWEEVIGITADEALAASSIKKNRPDARMVLMDILANGPVHVKLIEERAAAHGLSKDQLRRAREKMGVGVFKERTEDGRWFWALPQHMPKEEEDAA